MDQFSASGQSTWLRLFRSYVALTFITRRVRFAE